jgi:hypothetical protein
MVLLLRLTVLLRLMCLVFPIPRVVFGGYNNTPFHLYYYTPMVMMAMRVVLRLVMFLTVLRLMVLRLMVLRLMVLRLTTLRMYHSEVYNSLFPYGPQPIGGFQLLDLKYNASLLEVVVLGVLIMIVYLLRLTVLRLTPHHHPQVYSHILHHLYPKPLQNQIQFPLV